MGGRDGKSTPSQTRMFMAHGQGVEGGAPKKNLPIRQLKVMFIKCYKLSWNKQVLRNSNNEVTRSNTTRTFGQYFEKEWIGRKEQWAYCHRIKFSINTNMFVEAFHRVFKRVYLGEKVNKRVDRRLVYLMKFIRDRF